MNISLTNMSYLASYPTGEQTAYNQRTLTPLTRALSKHAPPEYAKMVTLHTELLLHEFNKQLIIAHFQQYKEIH